MAQIFRFPILRTREERKDAYEAVEINCKAGHGSTVGVLKDISGVGALIRIYQAETLPSEINLWIPALQKSIPASIRWRKGHDMGVRFDSPVNIKDMLTRPKRDRREVVASYFRPRAAAG